MTITSPASSVAYQGNGATTAFPFKFLIPTADTVVVTVTDTTRAPIDIATLTGNQFTISGLGDPAGGTITCADPATGLPIAAGKTLTIRRVVPYRQDTAIPNQGGFYPDVLEGALDTLEMQIQQLVEILSRSITVPVGSSITPAEYLELVQNAQEMTATASATASAAASSALTSAAAATAAATAAQQAVGGVRVSATDTTAGPLSAKLEVAGLVAGSIANPGAAEVLTLSVPIASQAEAEAGTAADQAMTPQRTAQAIAARAPFPFRNLLINTDFRGPINQRAYASGTATTVANQFTLDRWFVVTSGQALSWSAGVLTAPAGGVSQVIEGALILRSGTHVVSWTGTASATVDGTPVTNGGTVTLTRGANAVITFLGGTVQSPQVEYGSTPTPWEPLPPDIVMTRCKRYYQTLGYLPGFALSTTTVEAMSLLPVEMRAAPTTSIAAPVTLRAVSGSLSQSATSLGTSYSTPSSLRLEGLANFSGLTAGQGVLVCNLAASSNPLLLSAEITS